MHRRRGQHDAPRDPRERSRSGDRPLWQDPRALQQRRASPPAATADSAPASAPSPFGRSPTRPGTGSWESTSGAVLYGLQVFVPAMSGARRSGPHRQAPASVAGLIPGASAYSVSKHGVLTLTEGLWHHLRAADASISASVLCPGFVNTQINEAERNRPSEFGQSIEANETQRMASRVFLGGGHGPRSRRRTRLAGDGQRPPLHPPPRRLARHHPGPGSNPSWKANSQSRSTSRR